MDTYENYRAYLRHRDHQVNSWFLTSTIIPVVVILKVYILISIKFGPKFMKSRSAYNLKKLILVYNAIQVVFNLWLTFRIVTMRSIKYMFTSCMGELDLKYEEHLLEVSWWFLFNKIIDLLDTFFMILKKKDSQINLLHLYHHTSTLFLAWLHLHIGPGVLHLFPWAMNTIVHVIMYTYYFLAGLGPQYQKYLWWKKYLTKLQMVQFLMLIAFIAWSMVYCPIIQPILIFSLINPTILFTLFWNFYHNKYRKQEINGDKIKLK